MYRYITVHRLPGRQTFYITMFTQALIRCLFTECSLQVTVTVQRRFREREIIIVATKLGTIVCKFRRKVYAITFKLYKATEVIYTVDRHMVYICRVKTDWKCVESDRVHMNLFHMYSGQMTNKNFKNVCILFTDGRTS